MINIIALFAGLGVIIGTMSFVVIGLGCDLFKSKNQKGRKTL